MIDSASLLKDLKGRLKLLQTDLKARADDSTNDWGARLKEEYVAALKRERTGHSWSVWRDNEVDQAAVAWIISTTFLRFCEDNNLLAGAELDGKPVAVGWISGPGDSVTRSEENLSAYFLEHPDHNRRHWLQQGFHVLAAQPAGSLLIDPDHNPVWAATISQDAASSLIEFWRTADANGVLLHDFTDPTLDTRFLGDLYQDLSDHAKKTYALLQTPVFVEEFILDQTLEPAVKEFGLDGFKMIDPTCGSGHFLLGAFARLHQKWQAESPAMGPKELVRKAMDSIHGVDLNPFAVAIARFRLTVAGLQAAGETSLVGVAPMGFHLAIGDSLLGEQGGARAGEFDIFGTQNESTFEYDGEDLSEYAGILTPGKYHAVVGNPPYITVKDKILNLKYRESYKTTKGKYALSVPFMELFFRLAIKGAPGQPAGFTGQITSNSFMKREFGKKLIEEFFAGFHTDNPVDLLQVIDTSGAYIPGHGTPTVIIVGRRRRPQTETIRAVLGVRGEPGQPKDPAKGLVWTEITQNITDPGFEGSYVSVADLYRATLTMFPWSLSGGGANKLKERIEGSALERLINTIDDVGFSDITGNDEVFLMPGRVTRELHIADQCLPFVEGDVLRDFAFEARSMAYLPVTQKGIEIAPLPGAARHLWNYRSVLRSAIYFGKTAEQRGLRWFDHAIYQPRKHSNGLLLAFAFVATHNHFALERGGHLFNKSAPVIKLPTGATEEQHLELLGVLNSSAACFWLKQVSYPKGGDPVGNSGARVSASGWDERYEFTGTKLQEFPLPSGLTADRARVLDRLAQELQAVSPDNVIKIWETLSERNPLHAALSRAAADADQLRARMIFEQEELDWAIYRLYGLIEEDLTYQGEGIDQIALGERAFEITLARRVLDGTEETAWFERHASIPLADIPAGWPEDYRGLVQKRLDLMESDRNIRLLEKPEFKRRWVTETWDKQQQAALRGAILERLEDPTLWHDSQGPGLRTISDLAHALRGDAILQELAEVHSGTTHPELVDVLHLALTQAVPYLAAQRYKPSGLEKFGEWQKVWDLQRLEDLGGKVSIPVPPKYSTPDFQKVEYWKARGKLDVPKERFISYPDLSKPNDPTAVLGWAGWSHRDQALALARELPGRMALIPESGTDAVVPLLAGLVELEPWLQQWHQKIEPEFGMSPASMITQVLDTALSGLALTRDQVTAWTPPAPSRGRGSKK
ncbi:BREX-2 system adenine-specific DNA-methyltransferase PglX [Paeniglutamicibacter sp. MACA_103]|uniref:BREX-2 system adenine-specific DNA-methyltransferase PglX n=1 Tax=Paeniglutamicibacter sp. MACA_103 TaxID=3377337 RepID=UPI00389595BA